MSPRDARAGARRLPPSTLARAVAAIDAGTPYKEALEALLLELEPADADWLMQVLRESRGAFAPLARAAPGRALFLGDPLSGTPVALGHLGFATTALDADGTRLAFAARRARALVEAPAWFVRGGADARLPFAAGAFDLVVREGGLPGRTDDAGYDLAECARVSRGEVILVADNRFGYKRSAGAHGAFHVLGPLEYTGAVASPARGQRSLWGYRRALARAGLPEAEPYALYPHSGQFVHVVALDRPRPRLPIGPKERANRLKILGARLGLFPVLTPSFALFAARAPARGPRRVERILAELCARIGEGPAEVDQLVATRGNTAVLLTRAAGERGDDESPAGRYCLHLPLCPYQQRLCERHAEALPRLAAERPRVPVPELFFAGAIEGAYVTCERRLAGHTAPDISDEPAVAERMLAEVAELAAALALGPPRVLDEAAFAELVEAKFELVLRHAAVPATLSRVRELRARARAELLGRRLPRVRYHADLRGKHVQIDRKGGVLGILDWGTLEDEGLPYVDLLHLMVHERKQAESLTAGAAWRRVTSPGRLARERSARERYAAALGLEPDYLDLVEAIYPVLVAAMAESHWDYSRPRWVHTQFEL